jgi:hypothetical protein
MSKDPDAERTPAERVDDIPRILLALRDSVRDALLDHKRAGNPVAIWKDGGVVWVQPEDIPVADAAAPEQEWPMQAPGP